MKYIVILGDGMADYPVPELKGLTPLQAAKKPVIDGLVAKSTVGMVQTVPAGMPPGSDVANLSVLGFNPREYYTGRSPLEALSMGVNMDGEDVAFRCNLVNLSGETDYEKKSMVDYSSDEITTPEGREIIAAVKTRFDNGEFYFHPGISYRHLLLWKKGQAELKLTPPHDISDKGIGSYLPQGQGAEKLLAMMRESAGFLAELPVNRERVKRGLKPANSLWFWGHGRRPSLPLFKAKYGLEGSVISAVDLTKGIGICAGMDVVEVLGATGNIHTNFRGKAEAALAELEKGKDFVYIHIEAPDEAGHRGELDTKIKAIEAIDREVAGTILAGLQGRKDYKLMFLPDHPTPLSIKTHSGDAVPFLVYNPAEEKNSTVSCYSEKIAESAEKVIINEGYTLMDYFLRG